jgi:hypothetical protein
MSGIYFVRQKGHNPVKIGLTSDDSPDNRIKTMETYSPWGIELVNWLETLLVVEMEKLIHLDFEDKRMKGEWFDISTKEIEETVERYSNIPVNEFIMLVNRSKENRPQHRIGELIIKQDKHFDSPYTKDGKIKKNQIQWIIWKCEKWSKEPHTGRWVEGCEKHNLLKTRPTSVSGDTMYSLCKHCGEREGDISTRRTYNKEKIILYSLDENEAIKKLNELNRSI